MKHKKNKKGDITFFGENVLGIIIAVLCLIVLIIIAVAVYNIFSEKSDLEKAQNNFKLIKGEIELIKDSKGINSGQMILYPPKNWALRGYYSSFPQTECYGKKSCLCICQTLKCDGAQKYCEGFDYYVDISTVYVDKGWTSSDYYGSTIKFTNSAEGLNVSKYGDNITISEVTPK